MSVPAIGRSRRIPPRRAPMAGLAVLLLFSAQPLFGQFGRNKLQYHVFDFHVIRTAHFDVYYYPKEREAAMDAARMAERAYRRLSRLLGHEFEERKPIILYASHSQFQETNALPGFIDEGTGGVTEFTKRRVILPFTGDYADFEHVLVHELVHAFQFDLIAQGLINQVNPFPFQPPLWFMEGMAEYLSIGKLDTQTQAWLRDAVLSGYLRTIPEMSRYSDYLSYRFGQSLWAYIGAKYGDETIGLILKRATRIGVERAFYSTLGIPLEELSDEWIESVRTRYLPEVAGHGTPAAVGHPLTDHQFRPRAGGSASYLAPALSPDGRRIAYLSDRGNRLYSFFDLWLASAEDGHTIRRLVKAARTPDFESLRFISSSAAWSPDGRYLAFVAQSGGGDALYVYSVAHRHLVRRIRVDVDGIQNPTFSPDGQRIAFTGIRGGISDLYVVDANGRHFRQLTDDRYADLHPAWSPDGRFIALSTDRGDETDFGELVFGPLRIALYEMGSGRLQIAPFQDRGRNVNPVWSPDGDALAFVSDRTGINNVFIWSRRDGRLYQLTDLLTGVSGITPLSPSLSWAARADRLAFTAFEGAGYNIYAVDDPLSRARPVTPTPVTPTTVAEAPDTGSSEASAEDAARGATPASAEVAADTVADRGPAADPRAAQSFYRTSSGFRPSGDIPGPSEVVRKELTIADLLEDAESGLPDTTSFQLRPYRARLTPDLFGRPVIGAQVGGTFGNGVYGGSYLILSDMLGNENVVLSGQVAGSLSDSYLLAEYAYLRERANLAMSYQQFPLYRFRGTTVFDDASGTVVEDRFLRDIYRSLSTEIHYPLNTFQRVEFGLTGAYISRDSVVDRFTVGPTTTRSDRVSDRVENLMLAGPSLALVWDNALFGFTAPIAGRRYRLEVSRFFGNVEVNDVLVDFRNYLNLGGQYALATRLLGLWRSGPSRDQFRVYWGGPYFLRGYDGGSFGRSECEASAGRVRSEFTTGCPVRDQLVGSSLALANVEMRFPIFNFLDLGVVPLGLPPVDGVAFFDVGTAFDDPAELAWSRARSADPSVLRSPLASYGFGLRVNISYIVLRVDYAIPLDRPDHRGGIWSLAFGPGF